MARSALIVPLFFSKVFTNVAKSDFRLCACNISGWVSERDALERIQSHSEIVQTAKEKKNREKTFRTNALQKTFASYGRTDLDFQLQSFGVSTRRTRGRGKKSQVSLSRPVAALELRA